MAYIGAISMSLVLVIVWPVAMTAVGTMNFEQFNHWVSLKAVYNQASRRSCLLYKSVVYYGDSSLILVALPNRSRVSLVLNSSVAMIQRRFQAFHASQGLRAVPSVFLSPYRITVLSVKCLEHPNNVSLCTFIYLLILLISVQRLLENDSFI